MSESSTGEPDGRRARRERGRAAVIDAVFELLREGKVPPPAQLVAERAGVSEASLFRYFESLQDLQREALARFVDRFGHLFAIPGAGTGPLDDRVAGFVSARRRLYREVAPMLRLTRARAVDHEPSAEAVAISREMLAEQVRSQFAPELATMTPARAADAVALVDSLSSPETWEILQGVHGRSERQITRIWSAGIAAALTETGGTG